MGPDGLRYANGSAIRSVATARKLTAIPAATPRDSVNVERLVRNGILWAAGTPVAYPAPWPEGRQSALLLVQDVEAEYQNAFAMADLLEDLGLPGTFFPVSRLVMGGRELAQALVRVGEVGSQTSDHTPVAGLTYQDQLIRLRRTYSEIEEVSGYVGNFTVRIRKKPSFVRAEDCTACGDCAEVCPEPGGNEFDMALKARKAIYRPFPQSEPAAYIIDREACLNEKILVCQRCMEVCEPDAIDFDDRPAEIELDVGAVVVASGVDLYDPTGVDFYGYGRLPNVVTATDFERLLSSSGPYAGTPDSDRPGWSGT